MTQRVLIRHDQGMPCEFADDVSFLEDVNAADERGAVAVLGSGLINCQKGKKFLLSA